jgi:transcriptional regulator with XRE-family HTH domain
LSIATKLQELRRKSGESLQQVADGVGVSKGHVWALEKGTADNPSLDLISKLADHFKVTVAYFNDDAAEPADAAALQFFREFDGKLDEREWNLLRNLAKGLKAP